MKTNSNRWWDLPAASLLVVALVTAATRLVATNWTDDLSLVQTVAFLGAIAGLALGQSRFSPKWAAFFAIAYGIFVVPWQLGITVGRGVEWTERLASLIGRLTIILTQLYNRQVVQDSLLFLVLMAALFWLLAVHAGYTLTRYGMAWQAILPSGLALFVIHSFDAILIRRAWYLAVFLFFALVLVARMAYLHHHTRWQESRTALPPHLGLDFIRFTLLAAAIIVIFSWTAPALAETLPAAQKAWQPVREVWNEARDRFDNVFASLRSTVGVVSDYYGADVVLGRGNRLSDQQVFAVKVPAGQPAGTRFYWRAKSYDTYTGERWRNTVAIPQTFNPNNFNMTFPEDAERWIANFEIVAATPMSTLLSPAQPLWVSRPAQAETAMNPDGTEDLTAFRATPALRPGEVYEVRASISNATISSMRAAGTDYPSWVTDRYLQLPSTVTPRTRELAQQVTAGLENPYDKAMAITNYLRSTIAYSEVVPEKPPRQDPVDWFLFDIKQGFCNYYATAEIVMLRSLGIPARWAVGYAQGEKIDDNTYVVRQREAHAWPEVYFPGLGWVEFEPTASQPSLARLVGANSDSTAADAAAAEAARLAEEELRALREDRALGDGTGAAPVAAQTQGILLREVLPILAALAILAFVGFRTARIYYHLPAFPVLLVKGFEKLKVQPPSWLQRWAEKAAKAPPPRPLLPPLPILLEKTFTRLGMRTPALLSRWAAYAALPQLSKSYLEINGALSRLGSRPAATDTPAERAAHLGEIVPAAETPAQRLVAEYQIATFSPQPADLPIARQAGSDVRSLSYRAMIKGWFSRLQQPPKNGRVR